MSSTLSAFNGFPIPGASLTDHRLSDIQAVKSGLTAIDTLLHGQNTAIADLAASQSAIVLPVEAVANVSSGLISAADQAKLNAVTGTNTGDQSTVTGNAGSATVLQNARLINGVSFNGSADISINASKADLLTTARNINGVAFDGGSNITVNAPKADALTTARLINGVLFDGTTNITISATDNTARVATSQLGVANGVATLDGSGMVPAIQLPSYVDDVLEFADLAALPVTGTSGKIYIAIDTEKQYRWSGTTYVAIYAGAVDSVAGKTGIVTLVKADVGLSNVDNTTDANKPVSTAQATAIAAAQTAAATDATTKANAAAAASTPVAHAGSGGVAHANAIAAGAAGFMTGTDKTKLDGITAGAQVNAVTSVAGRTGAITLAVADVTGAATVSVQQVIINANYTAVLSDAGKQIFHPSSDTTSRTVTIPANASVAYEIGTALTFVNQNAAGLLVIAVNIDLMRIAGTGATGVRSLAANGAATALKITATEWLISGTNLT